MRFSQFGYIYIIRVRAPTREKVASSPSTYTTCDDTAGYTESFCIKKDAKRRCTRPHCTPPGAMVYRPLCPNHKQPMQTCSHTWILPCNQENAMRTSRCLPFPLFAYKKHCQLYTHAHSGVRYQVTCNTGTALG